MITSEHLEALAGAPPIPSDTDPLNPVQPPQTYANPFEAAAQKVAELAPDGLRGDLDTTGKAPLDVPLQPRDPATGQFVAAPAEAEAAPVEGEVVPESDTTPAEPEVPVVDTIVVLDRNGKELPIEITDPEAAEALRMLKNNAMRRDEFNRRIAPVEQKEQELRAFEIMLKTAPEQIVDTMHPEIRRRTLLHLLSSDFKDVLPILEQWAGDDTSRREFALQSKEQLSQSTQQVTQQITEGNRVAAIQRAIEAQIPEHASVQDANDFYRLAAAEIGEVDTQRGRTLKAEDVPALLTRHLARFGFDKPTAQTPSTPGSLVPTTPAVAAPTGAKAEEIARKAQAHKARMTSLPQQQLAARSVAPAGAGVAPAIAPKARNLDEAAQMIANIYRQSGRS